MESSRVGGPAPAQRPRRHVGAVTVSTVSVLLVVAFVLGWFGSGPLAAAGPVPPGPAVELAATRSYVVQPGDTAWSIARQAQPDGDVRPLVSRLLRDRGGGPLHPGEVLLVP